MSNINILNRNWMLPEERELAEATAKAEPNTCVNRFTERLNRSDVRKDVPLSVNAAKEEIKLGGGLKSGKLRGYTVPKEKDILRFLKSKGAILEDEFQKEHPVKTVEEKIYNEVTQNVTEVESSPEAEESVKLSKWAMLYLHILHDKGYNPGGLGRLIKERYSITGKELSDMTKELLDIQIIQKESPRRFRLGLSEWDIKSMYKSMLKESTLDYTERVGIKYRTSRKSKKLETQEDASKLPEISLTAICEWLDEGVDYSHWNLAKKFNISDKEAFRMECYLMKKRYLTKINAYTSEEKVVPTFFWQEKNVDSVDKVKKEEKKEVFKNFHEIPSSTNPLEFPKDIVFKNSNIRIINESGKELDIIVRSTEIIVKIK